ncbi:MAG: peptidyl-prolyl cis-trans isomerase [Candidatus Omnitrophota bacterium]
MNKYRDFTFFLAVLVLLIVSGCGKAPEGGVVIATIGDSTITVADFNERVANLPPRYREIVEKRKAEFLEEIINDALLYQEAVRIGLPKDKDVQKVIDQARQKILIARLLKDRVDDSIEITDEEIIEFYNSNKDKYMTPEIMRVSHILVPTQEEAAAILQELSTGKKSFEDIARAKSVDPTAQRGGDVGYFPKGQLMPRFEEACAKLDVNETSGVVKTKLGYHIIKLTDRRAPAPRPLEQVKGDIRSRVHTIEGKKIFNELLYELREKTDILIDAKALAGAYTTGSAAPEKSKEVKGGK